MKKLLTAFAIFICIVLNVKAQVDESKNFVYLYSDSVIYAKNIRIRHDLFNSLQLRADSRPVPLQSVKFFNNDEGFFANIKEVGIFRQVKLAERIIAGKINLYQERPYRTFFDYRHQNNNNAVDPDMFYNKGFENLKKVNYANLKVDMKDNPGSLNLLEGYRKNTRTSNALYVAAGASVVTALVTFFVDAKDSQRQIDNTPFDNRIPNQKNKNFSLSIGLFGVGAGLALGGYTTHVSGLKKLETAVDIYNR